MKKLPALFVSCPLGCTLGSVLFGIIFEDSNFKVNVALLFLSYLNGLIFSGVLAIPAYVMLTRRRQSSDYWIMPLGVIGGVLPVLPIGLLGSGLPEFVILGALCGFLVGVIAFGVGRTIK